MTLTILMMLERKFKERNHCSVSYTYFGMFCLEFSLQRTISEMRADLVQHPVYGLVPRVGWAALKKGIEVSCSVVRKV